MKPPLPRGLLGPALLFHLVIFPVLTAGGEDKATPDLSEYRTVANAITAPDKPATHADGRSAGFLGISLEGRSPGKLVVAEVASGSPAEATGVRRGDVIMQLDGKAVTDLGMFREEVAARSAGDPVRLSLQRDGKIIDQEAKLGLISRPLSPGAAPSRGFLGVTVSEAREGVEISQVVPGSPAAKAKLKEGEVILKVNDVRLGGPSHFRELLSDRKPDETLTLTLFLAEKAVDLKVTLEPDTSPGGGRGGGAWNFRTGNYWQKDVYRLAVILIDYPDVKHSPRISAQDWDDSFFSRGKYTKTATGQPAYGSLADYYFEQSYGKLKVEGKVFEPVEVSKKRAEYGVQGSSRTALLTEAMDKILARDGKEALAQFDGVNFIYSGGRMNVARGSLYWPHRSSVQHGGKRWPYFICSEGGERMGNTSVFCHEFGHMLGLPDLYARPENPGSEGLSVWCAMSNQAPNGRPQHFCAWAKEKLGWIQPCVIDPAVPQKLILAPIEDSPKECFKVMLRPDGTEYLLLENRRKKGFDQSLPAEGLLIWRVVQNRPILEESHGVEGPAGPRVYQGSVPYPSTANDSYTPYTTPSSRSQLGGGRPVHITNIQRLADGRISFHVGYEYH